jgi:hypothetical protein
LLFLGGLLVAEELLFKLWLVKGGSFQEEWGEARRWEALEGVNIDIIAWKTLGLESLVFMVDRENIMCLVVKQLEKGMPVELEDDEEVYVDNALRATFDGTCSTYHCSCFKTTINNILFNNIITDFTTFNKNKHFINSFQNNFINIIHDIAIQL